MESALIELFLSIDQKTDNAINPNNAIGNKSTLLMEKFDCLYFRIAIKTNIPIAILFIANPSGMLIIKNEKGRKIELFVFSFIRF